jgi:hypothetical protein
VTQSNPYIPSRGDIVYLDFDPTKGHEQKGLRPAFVLSPRAYNEKSSLALFMPITKQQKGYPFEVPPTDWIESSRSNPCRSNQVFRLEGSRCSIR